MKQMEESPGGQEPTELVRLADKRLSLGFRFGYVRHLRDARRVAELVPAVDDPFVRCSFRSMYSWALTLGCVYREAQDTSGASARRCDGVSSGHCGFHAQAMLGYSLAGLRDFRAAEEQLRCADEAARRVNDPFAEHNAYALMVRVLLQQGRAAEACALEPPDVTDSVRGMRGEVLASRALALVTLGRLDEAIAWGKAAAVTQGVETKVLWPAIRAVAALKTRDSDLVTSAEILLRRLSKLGPSTCWFVHIARIRSFSRRCLRPRPCSERTVFALTRSGDREIASAMGLEVVGEP